MTNPGYDTSLDAIIDEFNDRCREGPQPSVQEFAERYPEFGEDIRDLFPTLLVVASAAPSESFGSSLPTEVLQASHRIGDFEIIQELGRGGMGIVYEAHQVSLDRRVALKVLPHTSPDDDKQRERFAREAHAAGSLHHSNIVPVFGVGSDDDVDYLVMQLIAGLPLDAVIAQLVEIGPRTLAEPKSQSRESLRAVAVPASHESGAAEGGPRGERNPAASFANSVQPQPPDVRSQTRNRDHSETGVVNDSTREFLPPVTGSATSGIVTGRGNQYWRNIAELVQQASDALHYAHEQGVLHRDIKPGNLLLDTHGRIWISDFGLAKATQSNDLTHTGAVLGTLKYMAPELFKGGATAQSDVYSLGLTLYELAALKPAFDCQDRTELLGRVMNESPIPAHRVNPSIPRDLQTIIRTATERDPKERYATAADLAEDLRRFIDDEPIRARRVTVVEHTFRWIRRHKLLASLLGTLAVVLVATAIGSTIAANHFRALNGSLSEKTNSLREQADDLRTARNTASDRANENERLAHKAQSSLVGMKITSAFSMARAGKPDRAMVEMQAAWNTDTYGSRDDRFHQMRVGSLMKAYPELVGLAMPSVQHDWSSVAGIHDQYQPWNDLLLVSDTSGTADIWKPSTGERMWRVECGSKSPARMNPDGTLLLCHIDAECRLIDVRTGKPVHKLQHESPVRRARFSPDGKTVATVCSEGVIRFWNVADGSLFETQIKCGDKQSRFLKFIDNDRIMAPSGPKKVRIWAIGSGKPLTEPLVHAGSFAPTFSADLRRLATVNGKQWSLRNLADGAVLADFSDERQVKTVHLSSSGDDAFLDIQPSVRTAHYDFRKSVTAPEIHMLRNPRESYIVAISPDGQVGISHSTGRKAIVWNLRTHEKLHELEGVANVRFADYRTLIIRSIADVYRVMRLRQRHKPPTIEPAGQEFREPGHWVRGSQWTIKSPDGQREFRFADGIGRLFDADGNEVPPVGPTEPKSASCWGGFSSDSQRLITVNNLTYRVRNATDGTQIGHALQLEKGIQLYRTDNGSRLLLRFASERLAVWDVHSGQYLIDGREAAGRPAPAVDKDASDYELFAEIQRCVIAPNGEYVVFKQHAGDYVVLDVATQRERFRIKSHKGLPAGFFFTPDSKYFATANSDTTARVWDAKTGEQIGPYLPHPTFARAVALSRDGRTAATRDAARNVRLWDVRTGETLGLPVQDGEFAKGLLTFSNDLGRLIIDPQDGGLRQHRLTRVPLDRESARSLTELVTMLYDCGTARSETLTLERIEAKRSGYLDAWQEWRRKLPQSPVDPEPGKPVSMLPLDIDSNTVSGEWQYANKVLSSDASKYVRIELPVTPTGGYQVSLKFKRLSGSNFVGVQLPVSNGRAVLVLDSHPPKSLVNLEGLDGRGRDPLQARDLGRQAPIGKERQLTVSVRPSGGFVTIEAHVDGESVFDWTGESRRLTIDNRVDVFHPDRPAIQTYKSQFEFRDVTYTRLP